MYLEMMVLYAEGVVAWAPGTPAASPPPGAQMSMQLEFQGP